MALTATFSANFTSLYAELEKTEVRFGELAVDARKVQDSVQRIGERFSGAKLIEDAAKMAQAIQEIGGAAILTDKEAKRVNQTLNEALEKAAKTGAPVTDQMRQLAAATAGVGHQGSVLKDVFAKIGPTIAAAFTLQSIKSFAQSVFDAAGRLVDLSNQTGLSTKTLQQMSYAAAQTGATLDDFTKAAFKLGTNLASGENSVLRAVNRLGLSYDILRKQSPDQQFLTIAQSLGTLQNAQERNRTALELFGKGAKEILPAIAEGYEKLAGQASIAGDAQIKSLDMTGDALAAFGSQLKTIAINLAGGFVIAVGFAARVFEEWTGIIRINREALQNWSIIADVFRGRARELPKVLNESALAAKLLPPPLAASALSMEELTRAEQRLEAQTKAQIEATKASAAAKELAKRETDKFHASVTRLDTIKFWVPFTQGVQAIVPNLQQLNDLEARTIQETQNLREAARKWAEQNGLVVPTITAIDTSLKTSASQSVPLFKSAFAAIPDSIIKAMQGGGDVVKTVASTLGSSLGTNIVSKFGTNITNFLGPTLGGAVNTILPGVGALIGPLAQKMMGWIKGLFSDPMKKEIEAANKEIDKLKDKMLENAGSVQDLEARYNAMGLSIVEAFGGRGKQGLEALKAAQAEFNKRVDESKVKLDEMKSKLSSMEPELNTLISKAAEMGFVFNREGQLVGFNFDKVAKVAKEFGIELSALGPAFQQARLTAEAQKVIDAFTLLTMSGANADAVLEGMKDEINEIVRDSLQFGTTIPKNMEPMIEQLIKQGDLTDKNGRKITDMAGLKFGDPVKTEYEKINGAIQTILSAMNDLMSKINDLVDALDRALKPRTLTITAEYIDEGPPDGFGGLDAPSARLASGTMGKFGRWFANFGSGTLATLHGNEAVVRRDQAQAFAADVGGGIGSVAELRALRSDLLMLPHHVARAVRDAVLLAT